MPRAVTFAFALLVAAVAAVPWAVPRPRGLGADAPAERFAVGRALPLVAEIAAEPRPVGSAAHARARQALLRELRALGLAPHVQQSEARARRAGDAPIELGNVLARVPGSGGGEAGALLLMAHYDSRPDTPGAGDDAAGVAAALEALRARLAIGRPRNDLIVLLSDGEELGLLGARAFAEEHPWAREVGLVVNLDAIGNAGPAVLFETGPANGAAVRAIAYGLRQVVGGSHAEAIYRRLPRDTDFSVFRDRGVPGANVALAGNGRAYHSWFDTPERLAPAGLQHLGEVTLELLLAFDELDPDAARAPERHFLALPGGLVLHAPARMSRPFAALASAALLAAFVVASRRSRALDVALAHGVALVLLLIAALLAAGCFALGLLASGGWGDPPQPTLAAEGYLRLGLSVAVAIVLGLALSRALVRLARRPALLGALGAPAAVLWIGLLAGVLALLGDQALPLVAAAALPSAAAIAARKAALASALSLASLALVAPTAQAAMQVAATDPVQETVAGSLLVGLGFVLYLPALAPLLRRGAKSALEFGTE